MKKLVTFIKSSSTWRSSHSSSASSGAGRRQNRNMFLAVSSCLLGAAGAAYSGYYYVTSSEHNRFGSRLLAAETALSMHNEIVDETERRRKCSQLVKQFKVTNRIINSQFILLNKKKNLNLRRKPVHHVWSLR